MNMNNIIPVWFHQPRLPSRPLWRALLVIYNYYILEQIGRFRFDAQIEGVPAEVVEAARLLDCWLDIAMDEGWCDPKKD
jgi:hypothetical protein